MTDQKPEKKRGPRRTRDEIAAEKAAWLLRHEWSGPKEALAIVRSCIAALEEAQAACGKHVLNPDSFRPCLSALEGLGQSIECMIPKEAR